MDGTEGIRCEKTLEFKEILERRTGLEVILWDERLTTVAAEEWMDEVGMKKRESRKKYVDMLAAVLILQEYLDAIKKEA